MNEGPVRSQLPGQTTATPGGQPGYELETPKPGVNKLLPVVAVLGLGIACFGLVRSFVAPGPQQAAAAAPAPAAVASPFAEQTQMMREAMQMAREAREMQRERMEMMRKEMEFAEGGGEQPR